MAAFRSSRWANGETGSGSGKSLGRTPGTNTITTIAITEVIAIITGRFSPSIQVLGALIDLLLVLCQFRIFHLDGAQVLHQLRLAVLADKQEDHHNSEAYTRVGNNPAERVGRRQVHPHAVIADECLHDLVVAHPHRLHLRDT